MPEATTASSESKTKRKTTPRKKAKKKTTSKKPTPEDLIAKAKAEAERKAEANKHADFVDEIEAPTEEENETMPGLFDESEELGHYGSAYVEDEVRDPEEVRRVNAEDVFDYVEQNIIPTGVPVKFRVKRNGNFIAEQDYPLSWSDIQKTHGGGHYTVEARDAMTGRYIKSTTQMVFDPNGGVKKQADEEKSSKNEVPFIAPPSSPQFDPNEMLKTVTSIFGKMQEMNWEEKTKNSRDERRSENQFNQTLLTVMQSQSQATQSMMMEMQKNTQETFRALGETFQKSQERMDDKFTKSQENLQRMIEKIVEANNKKDEFSLKDMLMLQQSAEDRGWEKMSMLLDLSEKKAEERLAERDDKDSDTGIIAPLVKGLLPLLSGASAQQQMMLQQAQSANAGQPQRRSLPSGSSQGHAPQGQTRRAQAPQAASRPGPHKRKTQTGTQQSPKENPLGLPTFADEDEDFQPQTPRIEVQAEQQSTMTTLEDKPLETSEVVNEPQKKVEDLYTNASPTAQQIANIAIPVIAETIFNAQIAPWQSAQLCLGECAKAGFDTETVLREFTFDYMLQIAGAFGIGADKKPWFEEFYAYIQNEAGMESEGEDQPTLS